MARRFYESASVEERDGAFRILLDGKPARTPGGRRLALPTRALAEAIADEWTAQGEKLDPKSMPLTALANVAIDLGGQTGVLAGQIAPFAETDLVAYRAESPVELADRQAEKWDPVIAAFTARTGARIALAQGVIHKSQPAETVAAQLAEIDAMNAFELAAMNPLVTIGGSMLIALAVYHGELDAAAGWEAVTIDETWQAENWGFDAEAAAMLESKRLSWMAAARFLKLLSG